MFVKHCRIINKRSIYGAAVKLSVNFAKMRHIEAHGVSFRMKHLKTILHLLHIFGSKYLISVTDLSNRFCTDCLFYKILETTSHNQSQQRLF